LITRQVAISILCSLLVFLVFFWFLIPKIGVPTPYIKETETIEIRRYYPFVITQLEGDYSSWAFMWKTSYGAGESDFNYLLGVYEDINKIYIVNPSYGYITTRKLSNGVLEATDTTLEAVTMTQFYGHSFTVTGKYFVYVMDDSGVPKLKIYKDGGVAQTLSLSGLGWTAVGAYCTTISADGKYILVDNTSTNEYALFMAS
jgi:hypothetical protein